MKTKTINLCQLIAILTLATFVSPSMAYSKERIKIISVEEIMSSPGQFLDEAVKIKGYITQYNPATGQKTSAYYMVKGEYGELITVNTIAKKPRIQSKYLIKGVVKLDDYNSPYLIEKSKLMIWPLWIIIAVAAILIMAVLLIVFIIRSNSMKEPKSKKADNSGKSYDPSYKTVQVTKDEDRKNTLIHIPGVLVFTRGEDSGKELRLAGIPNKEGAKLTIGSREENGESKNAHIRIIDPTVSKNQAEIILIDRTNKILIKNLSNTNYTQVNGEALPPDVAKEIAYGDLIRFGSVELKYSSTD